MPITLISGEVGSGKTTNLFLEIEKKLNEQNSKVIFIVPDQISLYYEQKISEFFKNKRPMIDVLSFERLAFRVFSMCGPVYSDYLDDAAKTMLVHRAILSLENKLNIFSANSDNIAETVLGIISEFKRYMITPQKLLDLINETSSSILKLKLSDLYLIYNEYEKFIHPPIADKDDSYIALCKNIINNNLFEDTYFFIDQFESFFPYQFEIIKSLESKCKGVYLTFNTKENCKDELFLSYNKSINKLKEITPNITYINTEKCKKFSNNKELAFLEKNLFDNSKAQYENTTSNISLLAAKSIRNEIECCAAEILRLCRLNGYRFKDIAVVTRNFDKYSPIIKYTFEAYGINIYQDDKFSALLHPFIHAVLSLFDIINTNFSYEAVFSWIKFICPEQDYETMYIMENYVLACGNTKKMWTDENGFKFIPYGYTDDDLIKLNNFKNKLMKPVLKFINKFSGRKTVFDISKAFTEFLYDASLDKLIISKATNYKNSGLLQKSNLEISAWKALIELLDKMVMILGEKQITFKKYSAILRSGLSNIKIGQIPPSIDEVQIYDIERFKSRDVKCLFVLGVNNGVFPKVFTNEGILSDNERDELSKMGAELAESCIAKQSAENTVVYNTFISATEKLYISYSTTLDNSEVGHPSYVVDRIKTLFPKIKFKNTLYNNHDDFFDIDGQKSALLKLPEKIGIGKWLEVEKWFEQNDTNKLNHIKSALEYTNTPQKLNKDAIDIIYGVHPSGSISRAEQFAKCNYAYFLKYGLKLQERRTHKIQALDLGSFMHEMIELFSLKASEIGWKEITDEMCIEIASKVTDDVLNKYLDDANLETARFYYTCKKIKKIICTTAIQIASFYKTSSFVPLGYEISFDKTGTLPPIEIDIDGKKITLNGKIDRADILKTEKGNYICIVDYKSSDKNIDFTEILCGVQIQLPIYLKALCNAMDKKGITPIPAALYYYKFDAPQINGHIDLSDEKIKAEITKKLKMKGLTIENDLIGDSINPIMIVKSPVTAKQIEFVCKTAYDKLKKAFKEILDGCISQNPLFIHGKSVCEYCPYSSICTNSLSPIKQRRRKSVSKEEFFENGGKGLD